MTAFAPNAFSGAIDVLFNDPNMARAAVYRPGGIGDEVTIRVIARRPDRSIEFGDIAVHAATCLFDVRASEVPAPAAGDTITLAGTLDGETFVIQGEPIRDSERLIWTLDTRPA